ncbi:MAG: hypothetical protein KDN18_01320 [Verrucomicrobiae bacterium]|nr:hypothetical protein [Verrucomicrobiae bacterium]
MADCSVVLKGPSRTAARDRAMARLPEAMAGAWTVRRFSAEAKVSVNLAAAVLRGASARNEVALTREMDGEHARAHALAWEIRDAQIEQAERIEALADRAMTDLEAKADRGELSVRDLETLVRLREKHWAHVKDMAGLNLAEKIAAGKAKGEATGKGFAGALLDATALELGDGVFTVESDS